MPRNTITVVFDSDRSLTSQEQEAIIVQVELALTEPATFDILDDGSCGEHYPTDWQLSSDYEIDAAFPIGGK